MKRMISLLLAVIILMTIVSCKDAAPELTRAECVFSAVEYPIDESGRAFMQLAADKDSAYALFYDFTLSDYRETSHRTTVCKIDREGNITEIPIGNADALNSRQIAVVDGNIFLIDTERDNSTGIRDSVIYRLEDGRAVPVIDSLNSVADRQFSTDGILDFAVDRDGRFYLSSTGLISVFDSEMDPIFSIETDSPPLLHQSDGEVAVELTDSDSGERTLSRIDCISKALTDEKVLDIPGNASIYFGTGYELFYNSGDAVYGVQENGETVKVLDWLNSSVDPSVYKELAVVDTDTIICYTNDIFGSGGNVVYFMKRVPESEVPLRREIKVAVAASNPALQTAAMKFNRQSEEYRIVLVDYVRYRDESGDYFGADDMLLRELLSGTAPDLIETSGFAKKSDWLKKGAFADLNELAEQDKNFDRAEYFDSVFRNFTDSEGRMYEFPARFMLDTVIGKKKNLGADSWNTGQFIDFAENLGEGQYLFRLLGYSGVLVDFALKCASEGIIDYENSTCNFDTPEFRRLLEFVKSQSGYFSYAKTLSGDDLADYNADPGSAKRGDKILLENCYIGCIRDYISEGLKFGTDETVYIGYPADEGNGSLLYPTLGFAVTDSSRVKEGAWEFIKFATALNISGRDFSSCRAAFAESSEQEQSFHYVFGPNGSFTSWKGELTGSGNLNGIARDITDEDIAAVAKLIDGATKVPAGYSKLSSIITEELSAYISGAKELDETIKLIQDRCATLLAE